MTSEGSYFADDRDTPDGAAGDGNYSDGWTRSMLAFDDALVDPDRLDLVLPLDGRWPEPRLLEQTGVFYLRDRTRLHPRAFDPETAAWLLDDLHVDLPDWHAAAAFHEETTASSVTRDALAALGVLSVRVTDPQAWLESTVLFRFLKAVSG